MVLPQFDVAAKRKKMDENDKILQTLTVAAEKVEELRVKMDSTMTSFLGNFETVKQKMKRIIEENYSTAIATQGRSGSREHLNLEGLTSTMETLNLNYTRSMEEMTKMLDAYLPAPVKLTEQLAQQLKRIDSQFFNNASLLQEDAFRKKLEKRMFYGADYGERLHLKNAEDLVDHLARAPTTIYYTMIGKMPAEGLLARILIEENGLLKFVQRLQRWLMSCDENPEFLREFCKNAPLFDERQTPSDVLWRNVELLLLRCREHERESGEQLGSGLVDRLERLFKAVKYERSGVEIISNDQDRLAANLLADDRLFFWVLSSCALEEKTVTTSKSSESELPNSGGIMGEEGSQSTSRDESPELPEAELKMIDTVAGVAATFEVNTPPGCLPRIYLCLDNGEVVAPGETPAGMKPNFRRCLTIITYALKLLIEGRCYMALQCSEPEKNGMEVVAEMLNALRGAEGDIGNKGKGVRFLLSYWRLSAEQKEFFSSRLANNAPLRVASFEEPFHMKKAADLIKYLVKVSPAVAAETLGYMSTQRLLAKLLIEKNKGLLSVVGRIEGWLEGRRENFPLKEFCNLYPLVEEGRDNSTTKGVNWSNIQRLLNDCKQLKFVPNELVNLLTTLVNTFADRSGRDIDSEKLATKLLANGSLFFSLLSSCAFDDLPPACFSKQLPMGGELEIDVKGRITAGLAKRSEGNQPPELRSEVATGSSNSSNMLREDEGAVYEVHIHIELGEIKSNESGKEKAVSQLRQRLVTIVYALKLLIQSRLAVSRPQSTIEWHIKYNGLLCFFCPKSDMQSSDGTSQVSANNGNSGNEMENSSAAPRVVAESDLSIPNLTYTTVLFPKL